MNPTPELPLPHIAAFIRQHTHDVRNDLNGLDLEASLLSGLVPDEEGKECLARIRAQVRGLANHLRILAAKFADPKPNRESYTAAELFLIWQDQPSTLDPTPCVEWNGIFGTEKVMLDAAALGDVFRELLANAQTFSTGGPLHATARVEDARVVFELREPKAEPLDPASWGFAPFTTMRHGHYGIGLWQAQRTIIANGGEVQRHFDPAAMELITTLRFPLA